MKSLTQASKGIFESGVEAGGALAFLGATLSLDEIGQNLNREEYENFLATLIAATGGDNASPAFRTGAATPAVLLAILAKRFFAKNPAAAQNTKLSNLGRAGKGKGVREVTGTVSDARDLFNKLRGGNPVKEVKPGVFVAKGKSGGNVTFRTASKSGPPTVDVHGIEEGLRKIKFVPE